MLPSGGGHTQTLMWHWVLAKWTCCACFAVLSTGLLNVWRMAHAYQHLVNAATMARSNLNDFLTRLMFWKSFSLCNQLKWKTLVITSIDTTQRLHSRHLLHMNKMLIRGGGGCGHTKLDIQFITESEPSLLLLVKPRVMHSCIFMTRKTLSTSALTTMKHSLSTLCDFCKTLLTV